MFIQYDKFIANRVAVAMGSLAKSLALLLLATQYAIADLPIGVHSPLHAYLYNKRLLQTPEQAKPTSRDKCYNHRPTISAVANQKSFPSFYKTFYGENITIICSANASANLIIQLYNQELKSEKINTTTTMTYVSPNIGAQKYTCKDSMIDCEDYLTIEAYQKLEISITSPRIHRKPRTGKKDIDVYFVPLGDVYDIFCSGYGIKSYRIYHIYSIHHVILHTDTVNETTLKYEAIADDVVEERRYCCKMETFSIYDPRPSILVTVDYYPESHNFSCVNYEWTTFKCFWVSSTARNSFKLYHQDDISMTLLCASSLGGLSRACEWSLDSFKFLYLKSYFSLRLEICNEVFCVNETFNIYGYSILKLGPPVGLTVLKTRSNGVTLTWDYGRIFGECVFNIQYRMLTTSWRDVNATTVQCPYLRCDGCTFVLNLPCPDTHYEVKIYQRLETAHGELFWSEPSDPLYFFTSREDADSTHDPECQAEFKRKPPASVEGVLNEMGKLISDEHAAMLVLRKRVKTLREKLAKVTALLEALK